MGYKNPKNQPKAMRRWYLKNKHVVLANGRKWRAKNHEKQLAISAKVRAKKKGVPFAITFRDITIPEFCPVLGIRLQRNTKKIHDASPTLDRIIASKGYVPGNIMVLSNKANAIKRNGTVEEIRKVADWLAKMEKNAR